ncbi:MAG: AlpA family phage regulatory protein [Pseudomonadota bacterium]
MAAQHVAPKIIRRKEVEARTGLSRSSIYAKMRRNKKRPGDFDPTFPRPVSIGSKAVGWIEAEINQWIEARINTARNERGAP